MRKAADKIRHEWFRHSTWSDADRAEFEMRLARARASSRAQYLRIQALHLAEAGDPELVGVALQLLDRLLRDYPDTLQLASAHEQRAECLARRGDVGGAVQAYRSALQAERDHRGLRTNAWLNFGWLVVRHQLAGLYAEVANVLDERISEPMALAFPINKYKYHAVRALLAAYGGRQGEACEHARAALEAQKLEHSGFRYHPRLGLVRDVDPEIHRQVVRLAK